MYSVNPRIRELVQEAYYNAALSSLYRFNATYNSRVMDCMFFSHGEAVLLYLVKPDWEEVHVLHVPSPAAAEELLALAERMAGEKNYEDFDLQEFLERVEGEIGLREASVECVGRVFHILVYSHRLE